MGAVFLLESLDKVGKEKGELEDLSHELRCCSNTLKASKCGIKEASPLAAQRLRVLKISLKISLCG